jgi:hypothetical protein
MSKALRRLSEAFSLKTKGGYALPQKTLVYETPRVPLADVLRLYERDPTCKASVDLLAASAVGLGFYTIVNESYEKAEEAKKAVDSFNESVNLDALLCDMARGLIACGNDFWLKLTPENLRELNRLPADVVERVQQSFIEEKTLKLPYKIESYKLRQANGGSATISTGEWHCLEVKYVVSLTAGELGVWLDGEEVFTVTAQNTGSTTVDTVNIGLCDYSTISTTVNVDCVVVADAYIGPETAETLIEVADVLGLSDFVLRHKPSIAVSDGVASSDVLRVFKTLNVSDMLSLVEAVSTPRRVLQALEAVGIADGTLVDKALIITENISLVEVVAAGVKGAKRTKVFIILGDIAVQLTGE